ncbi:MAG TPA: hypothetical protein VJN94_11685 [Candidatus Binataceae bacterium]|nr:hypothetical protein [Candidatus Binataceae bacterium]
MILLFHAFAAEVHPIIARLTEASALPDAAVRGQQGKISGVPVTLVASGIGMRRSRLAAGRAMDSLPAAELVIISGVAGALRDNLAVGHPVLGQRLITRRSDDDFQPEQILDIPSEYFVRLATALEAAQIDYTAGAMMTSRRALTTSADKRRAHTESGAITVDMESAAIAFEAQRRGLPFVCLRTILDTASEDVVGAALADENGEVRALAAAKALITHPRMIGGVVHLLRNLRLAASSLASTLEAILPRIS